MTQDQRKVLKELAKVLVKATDTGLFDEMTSEIHPDTINTFCDAVGAFAEIYADSLAD